MDAIHLPFKVNLFNEFAHRFIDDNLCAFRDPRERTNMQNIQALTSLYKWE